MPVRDINFGDVTVPVHGPYVSEHSDKEYAPLRKAFLQLGEDYDKLRSENESLTMQKISDQKQQKWRDTFMTKKYKVGDTVEKPKLYNLILSEDYYKGAVVCLYKPIQSYELHTISSINDDNLKHNKKYQFTQEEIDECNKSFWIKNLDLNDYKVEVRTDEE